MSELNFVTKGNASPQGKPKVYFTCHPTDFERTFRSICEDIFKVYDCAVFYTEDMTQALDEETREIDLNTMNLFVIPVTFRLLTEPNRAMDEDFPFAKAHHIRVLPIMAENGIDDIYAREDRFGEMQYLSDQDHDNSRISYAKKMARFFDAAFLSKEIVERVRKAFDAYIFLSYRKKDRRCANELMRMIHERPELQRLAIWYDEFLTPGESFMENIRKILDDSRMMALLVTPSILEKPDGAPNFIMEKEYPAARESGTPVLPAEMVRTDRELLRQDYAGIPEPIDVYDESVFDERFLSRLRELITEENRNDPEKNYLVGMAYLFGVDVEVNKERGKEMITAAANADLPEAMERLREMYREGVGVAMDHREALRWARRLYGYYYRVNGGEDEDSLLALNELALIYDQVGDYQWYLTMTERCYPLRVKLSGERDPETLAVLGNLAMAHYRTGDYQKALELEEKCYRLRKETLGETHPDTLLSLGNLAGEYGECGDRQRMLELTEKCYQLKKEVLGESHPETLTALNNLAFAYNEGGYFQKALELNQICWLQRKKVLGEKHPDTLTTLSNLAMTYGNLGEYKKELEYGKLCWQMKTEALGEKHPETLLSLSNTAVAYSHNGDQQTALELNDRCRRLRKEILGEKHPLTLLSLSNLAVSYRMVGDHKKALELNEECYRLRKETLGEKHPDTLTSLSNLSISYSWLGDHQKALELDEQVYRLRREVLGEKHPDTLKSLHNWGETYIFLKDYRRAVEILEECRRLREETLGKAHPDTLSSMREAAYLYLGLGENEKALTLAGECCDRAMETYDALDPIAVSCLACAMVAAVKSKNFIKGLKYADIVYRNPGIREHDLVVNTVGFYEMFGQYNKANELRRRL
ncbi:MAG: tetratricopeptide repeat protein [Ruminococcus sp.]|nr:tetratricopeptide repeat protein [Ruminococcus sp.]